MYATSTIYRDIARDIFKKLVHMYVQISHCKYLREPF